MRRTIRSIVPAAIATGSLAVLLSAQAPVPSSSPSPAPGQVVFATDIQPIFAKSCWNWRSLLSLETPVPAAGAATGAT